MMLENSETFWISLLAIPCGLEAELKKKKKEIFELGQAGQYQARKSFSI